MSGTHPPARTPTRLVVLAVLTALAAPAALLATPASASAAAAAVAAAPAAAPVSSTASSGAGAEGQAWSPVAARLAGDRPQTVHPRVFSAYSLDVGRLRAQLDSGLVEVPAPDGELVRFRVQPTSVLEEGLAAAHPELRTWAGRAVEGTATIRLDTTPAGVHASVRGDGPAWYVDPAYRDGGSAHIAYAGADLPAPEQGWVEPRLPRGAQRELADPAGRPEQLGEAPGALASLRTYRLALLSDPAYAAYVLPSPASNAASDAAVLAAKTTLVNRLDQIYGEDLAIRLVLANGTDTRLNLWTTGEATGADGPCGLSPCFPSALLAAGCSAALIDRQQWVVGQLLGAHAYDLGHLVLRTQGSGGGVAYLGVAGLERKAAGCTGLDAPTGDAYTVDYLAHELGHQLGADHTFDGTEGGCGLANQRWAATAVEPGSGSTIMGYAGVCQGDDLQDHSDPVFSSTSQDAVDSYARSGPWAVREVQSVAFSGFDGTDAFSLTFPGLGTTATVTRGSTTYTDAKVKQAILGVLPAGSVISVAPFFNESGFDDRGFTVSYTLYGNSFYGDVPEPTVNQVAGSFTASANDVVAGNPQTTANGGAVTATNNHNPVVDAGADRTIPVRTPFLLTGSATDGDGDPLGYVWEQVDTSGSGSGTALSTQPRTAGPLFRVFGVASSTFANAPSGGGRTRSFPDLAQVVAGDTNAVTGACPAPAQVDCLSEWLPTAAYAGSALHFRLSARDAAPQAGGIASDEVVLSLDKTWGPFRVLSQGAPTTLVGGDSLPVTWTAGTQSLAANVRITLSTDGGATFPEVLAASTPNDGAQTVTLPRVSSGAARIRVEAVDNYFYDVNDASLVIADPGGTAPLVVDRSAVPTTWQTQVGDPVTAALTASSGLGSDHLSASATGLPPGLSLSARTITSATAASWSIGGAPAATPGSYPVQVSVTDTGETQSFGVTVVVAAEDSTVSYTGPTSVVGTDPGAASVPVTMTARVTQAADGALAPIDTATVRFTDTISGAVLCAAAPVPTSGTGPGTATCAFEAALSGARSVTYHVALAVGGRFRGGSTTDAAVTVSLPDRPATAPPGTTISSGPSGWLMATSATFGLFSTSPGAGFSCRLDNVPVACDGGAATLTGLSQRTHRFTAAAVDADGRRDETPAMRDFAVPADDTALAASGRWKRKRSGSAYLGTYSQTRRKGATLSAQVSEVRELALLVRTGKRYGKVRVYLGKVLLGTVRTAGRSGSRMVRVGHFSTPRGGRVRIVAASGRTVRIDGLGVSTASF